MLTLVWKVLSQYRRLGSGTVNQRIAAATVIIIAGTIVVKMAAAIKDILIAGHFGLSDELDTLLIAMVIPTFVTAVVAYSLNGAFIPPYVQTRETSGRHAANQLFGNVIIISFLLLLLCTIVLAVFAAPLIRVLAWEFSEEKLALARDLYILLLPTVLLGGQITLWGAVLNADDNFALAALSPILSPLLIMGALMVMVPKLDVNGVAVAIAVGAVAELIVLAVALAKRGLLPVPRWCAQIRETREVLRQYVPAAVAAIFMSGTAVIDNAMASWLGSGAVAALSYGNKIPSFLAGAGMTALGSAVLPHFSRLVALGDHASIRHTLRTYGRWLLLVAVPGTLVIILASESIVRVLFERGAFTSSDTAVVTLIQQMYLIQIPFVMVGMLGVRLLVAMQKNYLLTIMAVINVAVCVIGNLVFMKWLGVSGIALSTSLMYMVSAVMIWLLVHQSLEGVVSAPHDNAIS